jgi:hypothetical protein
MKNRVYDHLLCLLGVYTHTRTLTCTNAHTLILTHTLSHNISLLRTHALTHTRFLSLSHTQTTIDVIWHVDVFTTIIFACELVMKVVVMGFAATPNAYLKVCVYV